MNRYAVNVNGHLYTVIAANRMEAAITATERHDKANPMRIGKQDTRVFAHMIAEGVDVDDSEDIIDQVKTAIRRFKTRMGKTPNQMLVTNHQYKRLMDAVMEYTESMPSTKGCDAQFDGNLTVCGVQILREGGQE